MPKYVSHPISESRLKDCWQTTNERLNTALTSSVRTKSDFAFHSVSVWHIGSDKVEETESSWLLIIFVKAGEDGWLGWTECRIPEMNSWHLDCYWRFGYLPRIDFTILRRMLPSGVSSSSSVSSLKSRKSVPLFTRLQER
jgi:hypothetical protein